MSEVLSKRPLGEWRAALLRVTAFTGPEVDVLKHNFWTELGLGDEESFEKTKHEVTIKGPALDHGFIVKSSIGRVDWYYVPNPKEDKGEEEGKVADVGSFPEALDRFAELMGKWAQAMSPDLLRVALGSTAQLPVGDRIEGYRQLSEYLTFRIDGETSSDFLFQINRPRSSRVVGGLTVNRLTKWSVLSRNTVRGQLIINPKSVSSQLLPFEPPQFACQAVLDVNTDPEFQGRLRTVEVSSLLHEFAELSKEIVAEGDIP